VDTVGRNNNDHRPSILHHQGLSAALERQATENYATAELAPVLRMLLAAGVRPPSGAMGARWAIAVFRIFQEMLSNVARHAQASAVRVRIVVDGPPHPVLYLEVADNGVGAVQGALDDRSSYGVMGMRERAGHFGGKLLIDSRRTHGTRGRLQMPMPHADTPGAST
jgi:signal transduction histidine kinase